MLNKIKETMKTKNLKSADVIDKIGISKSYFYDVINGNSSPSLVMARKISKAIDSSLDEIFPSKERSD